MKKQIWTPLTAHISSLATHPKDDQILAAGLSAQVEYLVTGEKKLQQLGTYQDIRSHPSLSIP